MREHTVFVDHDSATLRVAAPSGKAGPCDLDLVQVLAAVGFDQNRVGFNCDEIELRRREFMRDRVFPSSVVGPASRSRAADR